MAETDVSFRYLLRGLPRPLLHLAFPRHPIEPLGPFDSSVDRPRQRTSDNLFRVRDATGEAAVHVEVEREWRTDIPGRLFDYATSAMTATRLPVWSVVVLLRPGGQPPRDTGLYRVRNVGGDAVVFRYHVVPLWLYIVSAAILGIDTARRIFHVESIIQDPNVQELIAEWENKGRAEGRAEGRTEGRADEARRLLLKVLAARSFPVSPDVRARIDGEADVARLEAWLEAAVTAATIGDVFRDG